MKTKLQISRDQLEDMRSFLDELPENQAAKLSAAQTIAELRKSIEKAQKRGWSKEQISQKIKDKFSIDINPKYITVALREKKPRSASANKDTAPAPGAPAPQPKTDTGTEEVATAKKG
jgi:IS30 family transposase